MKIILYKDVPNLGEEGDVRVVAPGYARNYLLPRKLAVSYTKATEVELLQKQRSIALNKEKKITSASSVKNQLEKLTIEIFVVAGEQGQLFGSVTASNIVEELRVQGVIFERKKLELPEGGIKRLGSYLVKARLYGGEIADLKIEVCDQKVKEKKSATPSAASSHKQRDNNAPDDGSSSLIADQEGAQASSDVSDLPPKKIEEKGSTTTEPLEDSVPSEDTDSKAEID